MQAEKGCFSIRKLILNNMIYLLLWIKYYNYTGANFDSTENESKFNLSILQV